MKKTYDKVQMLGDSHENFDLWYPIIINMKRLNHHLIGAEVARTRTPSTTNYDVDSATWADLRAVPLPSAMEVTVLGHGSSRSAIDPAQVSMGRPNANPPLPYIMT
ncbi:unnamed protein product, partial [Vitis vinifera]